jgi:Asp-tRNA(Asn)/Glu-tRNA(Gln) amidotransferase A subunit family amidase
LAELPTDTLTLRDRLARGDVTAVAVAEACIDRIKAREGVVQAWAWFDADAALAQAKALDDKRASGAALGPLHGLPVGVKDIIDTAGIPTENGCPVDAGRVPAKDAEVVARLKAAGGVMFGKTVTTELAFLNPNKTRNPHNPEHTPGGSSSGSAAAVADGMIPLAIGTQTGGSVIRPAAFCGVTGFKPSFNAIPRDGVLMQSHSLDTLGVFARDPGGAALLADVLATRSMGEATQKAPNASPTLGLVTLPGTETADPEMLDLFKRFCGGLDATVIQLELPAHLTDAAAQRAVLNTAEMAHYYAPYLDRGAASLGAITRSTIEAGLSISAPTYLAARAYQAAMDADLAPLFAQCDALICPAAPGPAPHGLHSTGDAIFNGLWTMAGTPAITLPKLQTRDGMPLGVQLVGQRGADAPLMQVADWLWTR